MEVIADKAAKIVKNSYQEYLKRRVQDRLRNRYSAIFKYDSDEGEYNKALFAMRVRREQEKE